MTDYAYLIDKTLFACLIGALTGVWAYLFTGPLSESGMVFGWLKGTIYNNGRTPEWLYLPLVGCAKCSAFWHSVGVWLLTTEKIEKVFVSTWPFVAVFTVPTPAEINVPVFVVAVFTAYYLEKQQR